MSLELFFVNIPYNCSDSELRQWIESRGVEVESVRIIRDVVSGASPAFAYAMMKDHGLVSEAAAELNGKRLRNQIILVQPAAPRPVGQGEACASGGRDVGRG